MSTVTRTSVPIERITFTSDRAFDDVVDGIYDGIGRPDLGTLLFDLNAARTIDEYRATVSDAVGPSDLLSFLQLDEGSALARDTGVDSFRLVRIIAGNPVTMSEMARFVPEAGSYAPVTILVYETPEGVRAGYDTVSSALQPYGDERALEVARNLDQKVLSLLDDATRSAGTEPAAQ